VWHNTLADEVGAWCSGGGESLRVTGRWRILF
jgi:hypothetical protein